MGPDIQISIDRGYIRVVYTGKVQFEPTEAMLREVGQLAAEQKIERLLFDIRGADYSNYHVGTIRHAEQGPSLGIQRTFRVAFLGATENPMLKYIEDVTVNRGYRTKAFVDEQEAIAWLQGGA